jgi:hypothetical protein
MMIHLALGLAMLKRDVTSTAAKGELWSGRGLNRLLAMQSARAFSSLIGHGSAAAPPHSPALLVAMHYDMRPDRLGWTFFDVTTGRPVVWEDVPLTRVDLDAAHELLALLHRQHGPRLHERVAAASRSRVQPRFSLTRTSLK